MGCGSGCGCSSGAENVDDGHEGHGHSHSEGGCGCSSGHEMPMTTEEQITSLQQYEKDLSAEIERVKESIKVLKKVAATELKE